MPGESEAQEEGRFIPQAVKRPQDQDCERIRSSLDIHDGETGRNESSGREIRQTCGLRDHGSTGEHDGQTRQRNTETFTGPDHLRGGSTGTAGRSRRAKELAEKAGFGDYSIDFIRQARGIGR